MTDTHTNDKFLIKMLIRNQGLAQSGHFINISKTHM